jgi:hypothetical protein
VTIVTTIDTDDSNTIFPPDLAYGRLDSISVQRGRSKKTNSQASLCITINGFDSADSIANWIPVLVKRILQSLRP